MESLVYTIIVTLIISLISLVGSLVVFFKEGLFKNVLPQIIALAAGTLIGDAFIHLIPESSEYLSVETVTVTALTAFIIFFLLEKVLQWHHHHEYNQDEHTFGYISLIGDLVHNFLDGLILYAAFQTSIPLGFATAVAIILHEIPQEIGDFGVLLHSGFSKNKAMAANLLVSLSALVGGLMGYLWLNQASSITPYITAFAAGGFLYTGASDLLPEIRQKTKNDKSFITFIIFLLGIIFVFLAG
jgi:zinc and cadmium transporter